MTETLQAITAVVVIVAALSGCDSAPPRDGATRYSIASEDGRTISETFESADAWETISGRWSAEKSDGRSV